METTNVTEGTEVPKKPRGEKMRRFGQSLAEFAKQSPGWIASFFSVFSNFLMTLFTWVAGCDLAVIGTMPTGEINKKAAIGLTMLFTISVAAFAAGNAGAIFLSPSLVVPFAILWAGVIFSIDRAIIVFMDTKQAHATANGNDTSNVSKWTAIGGRFVIIFCMSYLTSTAVEMLIFEKEIEGVITEKREARTKAITATADSARAAVDSLKFVAQQGVSVKRGEVARYAETLDNQINALRQNIQMEQDTLRLEIQGRVGSGKQGAGPAAEAIRANISADENELAELIAKRDKAIAGSVAQSDLLAGEEFVDNQIKVLDKQIAAIDAEQAAKLAEVETVVGDGFKDRYLALQKLWDDTPFLMFMVFLLLMIIESMPILLKLFSGIGRYEEGLAQQYAQHRVDKMNAMAAKLAANQLAHDDALALTNKRQEEREAANAERLASHHRLMIEKERELVEAQKGHREQIVEGDVSEFDSELGALEKKLIRLNEFITKIDSSTIDFPATQEEGRRARRNVRESFFRRAQRFATRLTKTSDEAEEEV